MKRQLNGQLLKNLLNCFPEWLDHLSSHQQQCEFPLLHILAKTRGMASLFILDLLTGLHWYLTEDVTFF